MDEAVRVIRTCERQIGHTLDSLFYSLPVPAAYYSMMGSPLTLSTTDTDLLGLVSSSSPGKDPHHDLLPENCRNRNAMRGVFPRHDGDPELAPCECIDCFFSRVYCTDTVQRSLVCFSPQTARMRVTSSFELSSHEVSQIKNHSLHCGMIVASYASGAWHLSSDHVRLVLNGVNVMNMDFQEDSDVHDLHRLVRIGTNRVVLYDNVCTTRFVYLFLFSRVRVADIMSRFVSAVPSTVADAKQYFVNLLRTEEDVSVETSSFAFSLLDPLTLDRIAIPVRSSKCTHVRCFDAENFLEMYAAAEKKPCPVCGQDLNPVDLAEDFYVLQMLKSTEDDEDEVEMEMSGSWSHIPRKPHEEVVDDERRGAIKPVKDDDAFSQFAEEFRRVPPIHIRLPQIPPLVPQDAYGQSDGSRTWARPSSFMEPDGNWLNLLHKELDSFGSVSAPSQSSVPSQLPVPSQAPVLSQMPVPSQFSVPSQPPVASQSPAAVRAQPLVLSQMPLLSQLAVLSQQQNPSSDDIIDLASSSDSDESEDRPLRRSNLHAYWDVIDIVDWYVCCRKQKHPQQGEVE